MDSAATHLEYLPILGRSGTSFSQLSKCLLNVSVLVPVRFLNFGGMLLKTLSILLAGQLWIFVMSALFNLLPSTW